jgi:OmpA-OmpF porin, OOP family
MSSKRLRSINWLVLPILAAVCVGPAVAQTVEGMRSSKVMMFGRPPTVDELRALMIPALKPVPAPKIHTRGIEIVGSGIATGQRPIPTEPVNAVAELTNSYKQQSDDPTGPAFAATLAGPTPSPPSIFGFRINFALNSASIPRETVSSLDAVGGFMAQESQVALLVEGHTDASGSDAYNQHLSERRAAAVRKYLTQVHRIDPSRIVARGMGETEPLLENPFDAKNRRVEFERIQ